MSATDLPLCPTCRGLLSWSETGEHVCLKCMLELGLDYEGGPLSPSGDRRETRTLPRASAEDTGPRALSPGERLGRYQIRSMLGSGGMGHVYVAHDSELHREVALKTLSPKMANDPEALLRFRREARTLAALKHPNVVTVYSVEEAGGIHFLTMELVDGATLEDVIDAGELSPGRFLELAGALARAVAAAHARGIVHRDLKPTNVMLTTDDEIKVLDFGLAKAGVPGAERLSSVTVTESGSLQGTVPYMSPEQLEGRAVDLRSDVFSLGVVLYELAARERPFDGDSSASIISAILRDDPPPLSQRRPDLPHAVHRIIERCLEKEPDRRYPSAIELATELERLAREASEPGRTGTLTSPASRARSRRSTVARGALVATIAVGVAAVAVWRLPSRSESTSTGPEVDVAQATTEAIAPPLESGATTEPDRALQPIGTPDSDRPPAAEKRVDRTASSTDPTLERRSAPAPTVEIREAREPGTPSSASDQGSFLEPYAIEASLFKRAARPTQLDRRLESGASVAPDDKLFLTFSASRDLYVYVLNEDDRGEVHLLFPLGSSELVNPLRGGQPHRVPGFRAGKALNWQVSSTGGQEHLLVIASPERLSELENVLGAVPQAQQAQLTDDSRDRYPHSQPVRGIGGLVEEEVSGAVAVPASLLSQVLRLVESESSSPGIWIRRFDLGNQEGREREP